MVALLSAIVKDTPPTISELKPDLPRELTRVVHRCLAKDPERRYQSALDLRNDLEEIRHELESGGETARGQALSGRRSPWRLGIAAGHARALWITGAMTVAALILGALGALWWQRAGDRPVRTSRYECRCPPSLDLRRGFHSGRSITSSSRTSRAAS
jgi:hypothetical protein